MGLDFNRRHKGTTQQTSTFIQSPVTTTLTPINETFLQSLGFSVKTKKLKNRKNGEIRHL